MTVHNQVCMFRSTTFSEQTCIHILLKLRIIKISKMLIEGRSAALEPGGRRANIPDIMATNELLLIFYFRSGLGLFFTRTRFSSRPLLRWHCSARLQGIIFNLPVCVKLSLPKIDGSLSTIFL